MRKVPLLAMLFALGIAGVAYGATTVTNVYVTKAKVTKKSGTKAHPKPISVQSSYTVSTNPAGQRPNVIASETTTILGVVANPSDFKGCSTSRLLDPTEGPSTCPKGSKVGTGTLVVELGKTGVPSGPNLICKAIVTLYNGGGNAKHGSGTLVYYLTADPTEDPACMPTKTPPTAIAATLKQTKAGLVTKLTIPENYRHPASGFDSVPISATLNIPVKTTTVKKHKVGLFASIACPHNHQRKIANKFTLEDGSSKTATRLAPCS